MLQLVILFMGLLCTNPKPHMPGGKGCNGIHVDRLDGDTGGETGNPLPPPPPPPPPRS